jgi:hypothetical protein
LFAIIIKETEAQNEPIKSVVAIFVITKETETQNGQIK